MNTLQQSGLGVGVGVDKNSNDWQTLHYSVKINFKSIPHHNWSNTDFHKPHFKIGKGRRFSLMISSTCMKIYAAQYNTIHAFTL